MFFGGSYGFSFENMLFTKNRVDYFRFRNDKINNPVETAIVVFKFKEEIDGLILLKKRIKFLFITDGRFWPMP